MSVNAVSSGFRPEAVSKAPRRRFPVLISCVRKRVSIPVGSRPVSWCDEFWHPSPATEDASVGNTERKVLGIRQNGRGDYTKLNAAAPCNDEVTAEISRRHNNLNVLCLSGDMLSPRTAERMVDVWVSTPFEGGRHERRVEKIHELEKEIGGGGEDWR